MLVDYSLPSSLIQFFLVIAFFSHAIPMNIVMGAPILAVIFRLIARSKNGSARYFEEISKALSDALPIFMSFAISQGLLAFLFVQILYSQLFYRSSILMAVAWLSVVFTLGLAYYLLYIYKLSKKPSLALLLIAFAVFLFVAFVFSNNMTLMQSANSTEALKANSGEAQLLVRFIHISLSSIPVTGLLIGILGLYSRDLDYSKFAIKLGSGIYMICSLLQIFIGGWFLMSIPRTQMLNFMGRDSFATVVFIVAFVFTMISIIASAISWNTANRLAFKLSVASALVTIFDMIVMRQLLREWSIPSLNPVISVPSALVWALAILTLGLIVYLIWLTKLISKAFQA